MRLMTRFPALLALVCAVALTGPGAAQSEENLRKLSEIYKLIQDDETAEAVEQINALLEEAPEDSTAAAGAMLLRGQAYLKAGRNTQALSDFNAALWLEGLNASQRKDAVAGRQAALAELGLAEEDAAPDATAEAPDPAQTASIPTSIPTSTDDEEPAPDPAPQTASAPEPESASSPEPSGGPAAAWQTEVETAETEQSSGIGGFFSSLFGGGSDEPEPAPREQRQTAAVSGWTANTTDAAPANSGASSDGRTYRVQIASVGTRDGAESERRRLSRLLGDALQGATPNIQRTDTDAGNTYYRIVVGPQPSRDAASTMCESFKSRGVDCLVVSSR